MWSRSGGDKKTKQHIVVSGGLPPPLGALFKIYSDIMLNRNHISSIILMQDVYNVYNPTLKNMKSANILYDVSMYVQHANKLLNCLNIYVHGYNVCIKDITL